MQPDLSLRDSLTQVYTRSSLGLRLAEEVNRSLRYKDPFSILLLDVDYFKSVNDAFGHPRGDLILTELAKRLTRTARKTDLVFRYGGDEFVILLPNTDREQATRLGERLNEEIRSVPFGDKQPLNITISIGIACFPDDANSAEELFEVADQRHYRAKFDGRDRLVSKDKFNGKITPIEAFSRLIERDQSMEVLNRMLDTLPEQGRGVLKIRGGAGLGITRFLAESRKSANLRGYATLNLKGSPSQKFRLHSVLLEALREAMSLGLKTEDTFLNWISEDQLAATIVQWIEEKGKSGLLLTLDDLQFFDQGSLNYARSLFFSRLLPTVGLVYADRGISARRGFPYDASLQAVTTLEPLSPKGVQIWVRNSLKWEAPNDFIEWLHRETGGKPSKVQAGLHALIRDQILTPEEKGWKFANDFQSLSLNSLIETSPKPPYSNLPEVRNELVGRTKEVRFIQDLLVTQRWVTIHGPGGVGKSRLAIQIALESRAAYPEGTFYISMQNISTDDQFLFQFANLFGMDLSDHLPLQQKLIDFLAEKEVLFLIDNLDKFPGAIPVLAEVIEQTNSPRCLVTSRYPAKIDIENLFELTGLPCPKDKNINAFEASPAIQLFLQNIRRIQPNFTIDEDDIPALGKVCRLVAGNPLGIELAAALTRVIPYSQIATRIEQNPSSLDIEFHERLQPAGLLAIIDSFWQLLSQPEQTILMRLALFETGFNDTAARAIAGTSLFFLEALSEKALITKISEDRYELQEYLRQILLQKFIAFPSERSAAQIAFVNFFAAEMRNNRQMNEKDQKNSFQLFSTDFDNIRIACNWAILHRLSSDLLDLIDGCTRYFDANGQFYSGLEFFTFILSTLQESKVNLSEPSYKICYGKVLAVLGRCKDHLGRYQESIVNLEESLDIFRQCVAKEELAQTLSELAQPVRATGDYSRATSLLEESLALYRNLDHQVGIGDVSYQLGIIASIQNNNLKSERLLIESLSIFEALNIPGKVARSINQISKLLAQGGRFEEAKTMLEGSLTISKANCLNELTASILNSLGEVAMAMDCLDQSEQYYRSGIQISLDSKAIPITLELLAGIAGLWIARGKKDNAYEMLLSVRDHPATPQAIRETALARIEEIQGQLSSLPGPSKMDNLDEMLIAFLHK